MISHQQSTDVPHAAGEETTLSVPLQSDTAVDGEPDAQAVRGQEAEISRLTWAVLDGKATSAERVRLAELVNAQHVRRQS